MHGYLNTAGQSNQMLYLAVDSIGLLKRLLKDSGSLLLLYSRRVIFNIKQRRPGKLAVYHLLSTVIYLFREIVEMSC